MLKELLYAMLVSKRLHIHFKLHDTYYVWGVVLLLVGDCNCVCRWVWAIDLLNVVLI